NLAFGIKNGHPGTLYTQKPQCYCAARITGRGHQHVQDTATLLRKVSQYAAHETSSKIFECQRGPVKQFEDSEPLIQWAHRCRKIKGLRCNSLQYVLRKGITDEWPRNGNG